MIRLAFSFVRADAQRIMALFGVLVLALSSFLLLMTSTAASKAHVTGTLQANWRGSYDILVRPQGTQTKEESERGIVTPNFLSGIYGGISLKQLEQIRSVAHVDVAAPIAMVGAIDNALWPRLDMPIPDTLQGKRAVVKRTDATLSSRGGKYSLTDEHTYYYFTPYPATFSWDDGSLIEQPPSEDKKKVCGSASEQIIPLLCEGNIRHSYRIFAPRVEHYLLLTAVDPQAEAELSELDASITRGRYLQPNETSGHYSQTFAENTTIDGVFLPVLISTHLGHVDLSSHVTGEVLPTSIAQDVYAHGFTASSTFDPQVIDSITHAEPISTWTAEVSTSTYWDDFLAEHPPITRNPDGSTNTAGQPIDTGTLIPMRFATVGPVTYRPADGEEDGALIASSRPASFIGTHVPNPGSLAPQFREKFTFPSPSKLYLDPIGHFDPSLIAHSQPSATRAYANAPKATRPEATPSQGNGGEETSEHASSEGTFLGSSPLGTYQESDIRLANDSSVRYSPDLNLQGYTLSPPMLITSLDAYLDAFSTSEDPEVAHTMRAPISAVRVRVAGVEDMSDVSAEKIRAVAEQIAQRTGLTVDIMTGASLSHQRVLLEGEGEDGSPLAVDELWAKKGVLTAISHALDHKTLLLAVLIVLSALLTVAIGISAFLRSHAHDFRILATLGWARNHLARFQLVILALVALGAGMGAGVTALIGAHLFGLTLPLWQAGLALPLALIVCALAGSPHLLRGERVRKTSTVRPIRRRTRVVATPFTIGNSRLWVRPMRTATTVGALVLAVTSISFITAVLTEFRGSLVGSVLGEVISVQIRGADVFATCALALMGIACVAVATWISAMEDASAYATLQALGWEPSQIRQAIVGQNFVLAALGCAVASAVTLTALASIASLTASSALAVAASAGGYFIATIVFGSAPALAFLRRTLMH